MKLFTVGPVEMYPNTLDVGSRQIPYFRTEEFSKTMLECQEMFIRLAKAPAESSLAVLTASGTGAMETAVMNALNERDNVLVINGGSFGQRFSELCDVHHIRHTDIHLSFGQVLTKEMIEDKKGYTALLINGHETSTGQLYDLQMLGDYCYKNHMKFIVDAVSMFLIDPIDMEAMHINLLLTSSQKALALSPGLSFILVDPSMKKVIDNNTCVCKYFDLKDYFLNMERGQTPYTPAVGIVYELEDRLRQLIEESIDTVIKTAHDKAMYFRKRCKEIGLKIGDYPLSNGLTPLIFENGKAYDYFLDAKENYGLMLTPTGGSLSKTVLRIGHMGNLTLQDYDQVIEYFKKVQL